MDLETAAPEAIADGIVSALQDGEEPADVEQDGVARAAALIAELL